MNRILLTTVSLLVAILAAAQSYSYDVMRSGSSIGSMDVSRTVAGGQVHYSVTSKTAFKLLFSFEVEYSLTETFTNGVLEYGNGFNTFNGSLQKETKIQRRSGGYNLVIDGITTTVSEPAIRSSVSLIYYSEPTDGMKVYSQYFARYLYFQKVGPHQYKLTSPDGENTYSYVNGVCTRVDVSRDFATFSFEMKPESLAAVKKMATTTPNDD